MTERQSGYRAFKDLGGGTRSVHMDWFGNGTIGAIAEGFLEAAKRVVEGADEDSRHPDRYFWPAAFLLRHALELTLKEIIGLGSELHAGKLVVGKPVGHNLEKLWLNARLVLTTSWPGADESDLEPVDEVIADFHAVDPRGDGFRYATSREGQKNLSAMPNVLSLNNLLNEVEQVCETLGGAIMGLDCWLQEKEEWD